MMSVRPDLGLERLIHGLEQELLAAADDEFLSAAHDLGMNPQMKGSAAFVGVKDVSPQLLAALRRAHEEASSGTADPAAEKGEKSQSGRNLDA